MQDLRQSIIEQPDTFQYTCFHLEHEGQRINDYIELSEVKELKPSSKIKLLEDPYTEKDARAHAIRIRDLIGAAADRVDTIHGLCAGISLHDSVTATSHTGKPGVDGGNNAGLASNNPVEGYDFDSSASVQTILPPRVEAPPKTVKALSVSPWNPPPHHLRQKGHLLYLQLTTNEGEQFQITSHVSGFFVNKSSNAKFDPFPRQAPKAAAAHSLLSLIEKVSPSFASNFRKLQEYNSSRDPLMNFPVTHALPSNPWLVAPSESTLAAHQPDLSRTQEAYLVTGLENAETLRDWNEDFQVAKELPKENVQDRVFRERYMTKLFADYTDAAVRGAVIVARGEVPPMNPTEGADAQIFVYNNIFYSFGADGAEIFTTEGGDEAARVAVGKDVTGVKLVNQLDVDGLHTPGTVIVDYLGRRIVCQSIVPGIFKPRENGESQVDYGGVEGRDTIADDEAFVPSFAQLSKNLRVKKHDVWDKEGKKHTLEGSLETKGLKGTDGRKYVLDLYRLTPLDVHWLENYWADAPKDQTKPKATNYPHRMAVMRPELVEIFWRVKLSEYVQKEVEKRKLARKEDTPAGSEGLTNGTDAGDMSERRNEGTSTSSSDKPERVDVSEFSLAFNTDVFNGQIPQTEEEKQEWVKDEELVRELCQYLRDKIIPELVKDLQDGEVGFPMDGHSLARLMHKRGINVRYLGQVAKLASSQTPRLEALSAIAVQEMVARAFKHIANRYLKNTPPPFSTSCLAHLLNCLLGINLNDSPKAVLDEDLQSLYPEGNWSFMHVSPASLRQEVEEQVYLRYRFELQRDWTSSLKPLQLLRELCLKLGIQLTAKEYRFSPGTSMNGSPIVNGAHHGPNGLGHGKKKKRLGDHDQAHQSSDSLSSAIAHTFEPDDIVNIYPVTKDSCPRSTLADEALEAGRVSIAQDQKELGQELLVESLSLHEQIYGILHPEVARVYHQLATIYYQLEEKAAAVDLARKAVIVSERTLGLDCNETILSYLNLGIFEHGIGNSALALTYIKHALNLWKMIYGLKHPDSITTINNAAVMLQNLKQFHESRIWFEKCLEICEEVTGKNTVNSATLCFQLAQALALDADAKAAVVRMREAYSIFLSLLGPEDRNTKESESWLEQLTQNAVSIAKHARDVQAHRLRRIQLTPRISMRTRPQPQVGQSPAEAAGVRRDRAPSAGMDSRSVDELLKFIEGGGDSTKRRGPTKKNPKRRGGAGGGGRANTVAA